MSDSRRLVVATVNTYFGRAVVTERGLDNVVDADVILMQELFSPAAYGLESRLQQRGFELLTVGGHFGLGIALRSNSAFLHTGNSPRSTVLEQVGTVERRLTARFANHPLEYSDFGVLAAQLETPGGRRLTVAATHLPVVTSFRQRARFLARLGPEMAHPYYDGLVVLGGDMNHYPGPKRADLEFRRTAGLTAVDMVGEVTWPSRRTSTVGSRVNRFIGGQLDDILYRGGLGLVRKDVVDVASDHRAIVATFVVESDS